MAENNIPNPGSSEAYKQGCICPNIDNYNGRGYMGGIKDKDGNILFVINGDCPLHGAKRNEKDNN